MGTGPAVRPISSFLGEHRGEYRKIYKSGLFHHVSVVGFLLCCQMVMPPMAVVFSAGVFQSLMVVSTLMAFSPTVIE